jgi:hypothetical protein
MDSDFLQTVFKIFILVASALYAVFACLLLSAVAFLGREDLSESDDIDAATREVFDLLKSFVAGPKFPIFGFSVGLVILSVILAWVDNPLAAPAFAAAIIIDTTLVWVWPDRDAYYDRLSGMERGGEVWVSILVAAVLVSYIALTILSGA